MVELNFKILGSFQFSNVRFKRRNHRSAVVRGQPLIFPGETGVRLRQTLLPTAPLGCASASCPRSAAARARGSGSVCPGGGSGWLRGRAHRSPCCCPERPQFLPRAANTPSELCGRFSSTERRACGRQEGAALLSPCAGVEPPGCVTPGAPALSEPP